MSRRTNARGADTAVSSPPPPPYPSFYSKRRGGRTRPALVALASALALTFACGRPVAGAFAARVKKCCPTDTILRIDMAACTGFVAGDQDAREAYTWARPDGGDDAAVVAASDDSNENLALSLANGSSVLPWWVPAEMEFLAADNLSRTVEPDGRWFDGGGRIPCGADDREVTTIEDDLAVLDDGRLLVFMQHGGRRDGSAAGIDAAEDGEWITFSSAEYCVDRVSLTDNVSRSGGGRATTTATTTTTTTATTTATAARGGGAAALPTYAYVAWVCRPCSRITCVPKCCAKGLVLEYRKNKVVGCRKTQSVAAAEAAIRLRAADGTLLHRKEYYFFGMKPPDCGSGNWYVMNKTVGYGLLPDGRVQVDNGLAPIERDEYCVDAMNVVAAAGSKEPTQHHQQQQQQQYTDVMLACRLDGSRGAGKHPTDHRGRRGPLQFREILYGAYFVVGAAFLAATLLIYAALPELRVTVHSGNLIAHTACLFVSYATLAATTLVRHVFSYTVCVVAGFVIQFSFLAAFFWLNVMCADIAWTFSGFRLLLYSNKIENEKKKYVIYSIYAWGCSIGITILTALAEFTDLLNDSVYKPNIGYTICWFSSKLSVGVFFYLPIALLMLTNFILFLFTAFRIVFIRRDTSKVLNRQMNQNNMRLSLYLKLFCLMGVTFVFEVISWLADDAPAYYWYVTDAVNSLRGVFVFFIFCWKRSVLHLLLARAPRRARERFMRAFRVREPHRYPSFSSSCHHHHQQHQQHQQRFGGGGGGGGGSFQLSQFGSSASEVVVGPDPRPKQPSRR